ncbi:aminotransferase class-III [Leptodontidium sp. MPI-SDFR-AT-0119]|nr:aminotransferase class-III [Leptodontidium sp. MPI-SDFR-AT-0119]
MSSQDQLPNLTLSVQDHLQVQIDKFAEENPLSGEAIREASSAIPGGTTRAILLHTPFPPVFVGGKECFLKSVDGREYLDFVSEYCAGMFGHSHPRINEAIEGVLRAGHTLGGPTPKEGELAKAITKRFPSMDAIRFCNSGTEANTLALATALAYSQRKKILVFENGYHGGTLSFSRHNPLLLPHQFVYGRYNDRERTRVDIDVGAILIEPLQGAGGMVPSQNEFLKYLREEATRVGAVLIFDEVVSSRLYYGGMQEYYGVTPDMTTIGKHFGGGFSFGAFGGKKEIMSLYAPGAPRGLYHSGTWNNNVFTMTAGVVATDLLSRENIEKTNSLGDALRNGMQELVNSNEAARSLINFKGFGSVIGISFNGPSSVQLRDLFFFYLLNNGVYVGHRGFFALNLTHKQEHVDGVLDLFRAFLKRYMAE